MESNYNLKEVVKDINESIKFDLWGPNDLLGTIGVITSKLSKVNHDVYVNMMITPLWDTFKTEREYKDFTDLIHMLGKGSHLVGLDFYTTDENIFEQKAYLDSSNITIFVTIDGSYEQKVSYKVHVVAEPDLSKYTLDDYIYHHNN